MPMTDKIPPMPVLTGLGSALVLALTPAPALAYMGPGLGLGAIGSALGVVFALVLALASIAWYPVKRLIRRLRGGKPSKSAQSGKL